MSFTSATPDLLMRFRHKLNDTTITSWQQSNHILWVSEFIEYFAGRTLSSIMEEEVQRFVSRIEVKYNLTHDTRQEVLNSLRFMYREIDGIDPPWAQRLTKNKQNKKQGTQFAGLSRTTLRTVLPLVEYHNQLAVALIYGAGLKASECTRLRVGDLLFEENRIQVRNADGAFTHQTVLPRILQGALRDHLDKRRQVHLKDTTQPFAGAPLPEALAQGKEPYARSWRCQFVFADGQLSHLGDGRLVRRSINIRSIEKAIRIAADRVELGESVTAKGLRLSFARHMIQKAVQPVLLQYVLGQTAQLPEIYQEAFAQLQSPLDELWPQGSGPWR